MRRQTRIRWLHVPLAAAGAAAAIACHSTTATLADLGGRLSAWQPDSAATLVHETSSGFRTASRSVIVDQQTWGTTWQGIYATVTPQPPLPAVDFSSDAVVVASLGQRTTGGFDIRIDSVVNHEGGTAVYITSSSPGATCVASQSLTQPVHAVRAPRPLGPVFFGERSVVRECR